MPVITKLSAQQKNSERVNVFIDGAYEFSLTLDDLIKEKIKVGLVIDESFRKYLNKLSSDSKVRARTLEWLMIRPRSRKELEQYLYKKNIDGDTSLKFINEFAQKGYQNDENFAKWWVDQRQKKLKSNFYIRGELTQKGIKEEIIERAVGGSNDQSERLLALVNKKRHRYSEERKFINYLMGKGFRYSDIVEALGADKGEDSMERTD